MRQGVAQDAGQHACQCSRRSKLQEGRAQTAPLRFAQLAAKSGGKQDCQALTQ